MQPKGIDIADTNLQIRNANGKRMTKEQRYETNRQLNFAHDLLARLNQKAATNGGKLDAIDVVNVMRENNQKIELISIDWLRESREVLPQLVIVESETV
jgi:hypothetical protein